ncbi:transcriptional control factor [Phascolarctid gammaherpesvirus 1]|uniref:Transcriptional control factor n=1 Tax=Phascolarctid gammaherpesvirus 1 TaxID=2249313 RepID=A0A3Q8J771_9GAMA|nr:transcriptional control factor [Phascolarctid gammaherpesvirus 1]AZB49228.1 transcriptional control factor [Phascolarctid gammaherpesvirus 1]
MDTDGQVTVDIDVQSERLSVSSDSDSDGELTDSDTDMMQDEDDLYDPPKRDEVPGSSGPDTNAKLLISSFVIPKVTQDGATRNVAYSSPLARERVTTPDRGIRRVYGRPQSRERNAPFRRPIRGNIRGRYDDGQRRERWSRNVEDLRSRLTSGRRSGRDREVTARRGERPFRGDNRRSPMTRSREGIRLRTGDKRMRASFERMRVPQGALRPLNGPPFNSSLYPSHDKCISFIKIQPPTLLPEVGCSPFIERLVGMACNTTDLQDKSFPASTLKIYMRELRTFFNTTPNWLPMRDCRSAGIQQCGMVDLLAFQEETIFYLKCHLEECNYVTDADVQRDLIFLSIDQVCQQVMFKMRSLLPLVSGPEYETAIVRQLCYLVAAGNREEDCARMLHELSLDFKLGVLAAYCLVPMLFLRVREQKNLCVFIYKYLDMYKPGMLVGLFNQMLMEHRGYDTRDPDFISTVFGVVGLESSNRGLFFFPLPSVETQP